MAKRKVGRPSKYDPDFHPQACIELGKKGKFKVQMALLWDVDSDTINNWCKDYPEFFSAYKKAQSYRAAWLLDQGQSGLFDSKDKKLNALAWSMMMRYDGQNTDERTINLPDMANCNTFSEQANCVVKALSDGKLTPKEAKTLAEIISIGAKVEESVELKKRIEQLENNLIKD